MVKETYPVLTRSYNIHNCILINKDIIMLRISKCGLYLTSFNTITYQTSIRRNFAKPNKIKKLMKEYKSVFGGLVETSTQKKKRLKLEKKGKTPLQKTNEINTELSWVIENSGSNIRKIVSPVNIQSKDKNVAQCISESTSYSQQTNKTESTLSEQNHINSYINPNKSQTNPRKFSKQFSTTILKIKKPADQNIGNIYSDPNQAEQEIKLENTNVTCNLPIVTKNTSNNYNKSPLTEHSNFNLSMSENNNLNNNKLLTKDIPDIENIAAKHDMSFERLPDIIVKNLLSFPIISNKQESSTESTEVLSIFGKDDPDTIRFPSVTKILMQTMPLESKLALAAWKKRMIKKLGQEGFDTYQKELLEDGTFLHSCIAQSLRGKEFDIPSRIEPVFKSLQCVLEDVQHVKAIETHVAHTKLHYKGVVDCVASYRGENYVIDWKKSERKKLDLKGTYDAPIQIAAYVGAINASNLYPFVIKRGLLVIAYTSGAPATVYEVYDNMLQHYWTSWLRRLQKYHVETASSDDNKNTWQ